MSDSNDSRLRTIVPPGLRKEDRRPIVLGPDSGGQMVVVTGDRTGFAGAPPAPPAPGAFRVRADGGEIVPGRVVCRRVGEDLVDALRHELIRGATGVVLVGAPAILSEWVPPGRPWPQRTVLLGEVRSEADAQLLESAAAVRSDANVRMGVCAGCSDEGWESWAATLGLVMTDPRADGLSILERHFGRRFGVLEPGAAGDVAVMWPDGRAHQVVIGGRWIVRDGEVW